MSSTLQKYRDSLATAEQTVSRWLLDFLAVSHADLGRDGGICPFVKPALHAQAIKYRTVHTSEDPPFDHVLAAAVEAMEDFDDLDWAGAPQQLQSLIVIFPDLDPGSAALLDRVHERLKDEVVHRRLMFAQFHPNCAEPSVRNPDLNVGAAPVPLLAFRRLAVHDILFLAEREQWFAVFREAFGARFREPDKFEPVLAGAYLSAEARFGRQA